jgi:uncharacterized protein YegL
MPPTISEGVKTMSKLEDRVEVANPHQPHCATVLLLDVSGSMGGAKIAGLNEGIKIFKNEIGGDELAAKRVDLAVLTFGESVNIIHDFSSIDDFEPPELVAIGYTPMGDAITRALDLVEQRKQQYKTQGIDYYRPWIFIITDGEPTDMHIGDSKWNEVVKRVHEGESSKKFMFFAVAVGEADTNLLGQIAPPNRPPVKLIGTKFKELFLWFSRSQSKVSASKVGEQVALENPVAAGWGEIAV